MQALYPALAGRFGMGPASAGSLLTATTLGLALCAPFAGRLAARSGAKASVFSALAGLALTTCLTAFCEHTWSLVALRLLQGLLIPVALSALLATGKLWPSVDPAGLAATYVTGTIFGGLAGRFLPAALMHTGWSSTFLCFGGLQLAATATVFRLFPNRRGEAGEVKLVQLESLFKWSAQIWPTVCKTIPHLAIGAAGLMFSQAAITTFVAIRLASAPFNWNTTQLGALYIVFVPAILFVRLTPLALRVKGPRWILLAAATTSWVGLGLTLPEKDVAVVAGLALFSAAVFVVQTVLAHQLGCLEVENRELASGSYLSVYYLAASAGAIAPALIWGSMGWVGCLGMVAAVQASGLLIAKVCKINEFPQKMSL